MNFPLTNFSLRFVRGNSFRSTNCADTECNSKTEIFAFGSSHFIKFHNTKALKVSETNTKKKKQKQQQTNKKERKRN